LRGAMRARHLIVAGLISLASSAAADTKLVGTFSSWSFYAHEEGQTRLCFAVGSPQTVEPAGARRDPAFFYISAWPRDGVRTEVSIKFGYPLRKGSEATATIGSESFKLFTADERAYVGDPFDELKLIEAMKKGSTMVVQGTSERGTTTKDTYSLSGLSKAVQSLTSNCN
jgi:hypothetical protein